MTPNPTFEEVKETGAVKLADDLYWVGAFDPDLEVFDIIMHTPYGTTYNSYLLRCAGKNVLFETVKVAFEDQLVRRLKDAVPDGETVDYIVLDHTEPDHSGSAYSIYTKYYPDAKFIGTRAAMSFLKEISNGQFECIAIDADTEMKIGNKTLQFLNAPMLHWGDTMFTYVPEVKALITCDVFGDHFCEKTLRVSSIAGNAARYAEYEEAFKYYYDVIMGPFPTYVQSGAVKKVDFPNRPIDVVCVSHGPVLDTQEEIAKAINKYDKWSQASLFPLVDKVVVAYVSAYGFTREMAKAVAEGIESEGAEVAMLDLTALKFGHPEHKPSDALALFKDAKGIVLGTPTILGDALEPIWEVAMGFNPMIHHDRFAAVFGSWGWSGEGALNISDRLKQVRFKQPVAPLRIKFRASGTELKLCRAWGAKFCRGMLAKEVVVEGTVVGMDAAGEVEIKAASTSPSVSVSASAGRGKGKGKGSGSGAVKRWQCIVCGEIFTGAIPPEICPACGAGQDAFVEIPWEEKHVPEAVAEWNGTVVVIGGSAAGITAVKEIRRCNQKCKVIVLSEEECLPYYRPLLTAYIGNRAVPEHKSWLLAAAEWYDENNVDLRLGQTAVKINAESRTVEYKAVEVAKDSGDGEVQVQSVTYDRLIVAAGASNFVPLRSAGGAPFDNVLSFRTRKDVERFHSVIDSFRDSHPGHKTKIVFIGGGILALEAASSLVAGFGSSTGGGETISMLELMPRCLPNQLTGAAAEELRTAVQYHPETNREGINIRLGVKSTPIADPENPQWVTGLRLQKGGQEEEEILPADIVLVSIGVRSNHALLEAAGAKVDRGVRVDKFMLTSIPGVFACGDVANFGGRSIPNWANAGDQGKVAGYNAIVPNLTDTDMTSFEPTSYPTLLTAFNTQVYAVGDASIPESELRAVCSVNHSIQSSVYLYFNRNDVLVRGIIMGRDQGKAVPLQQAVNEGRRLCDGALELLSTVRMVV